MGGAYRTLHLLQPQRESPVGAGLSVPPPTGQSENNSRRSPPAGGHMGVNQVSVHFSMTSGFLFF